MRKLILILVAVLAFQFADAQVKAGLKVGISTADIANPGELNFDSVLVEATDAGFGMHIGGFVRVPLPGPLYIQLDPMLGSSRIDYTVNDANSGIIDEIKTESFLKLDVPVLAGVSLGLGDNLKVRGQAGPVGSIVLSNLKDELTTIDGLTSTYQGMTFGFQAGAGVDLGKLTIDANWEGGLSKFGDSFSIGSQNFDLDSRINRWVITLGYNFLD